MSTNLWYFEEYTSSLTIPKYRELTSLFLWPRILIVFDGDTYNQYNLYIWHCFYFKHVSCLHIFLMLEFGIIFQVFTLKNNSRWFKILYIWEGIVPKSYRFQKVLYFSCPFFIVVYTGQLHNGEFKLIITRFIYCGFI